MTMDPGTPPHRMEPAAGTGDDRARERRAERIVMAFFAIAFVAGVSLLVVYALGGQTQLEGLLLTACLGGIGMGIVIWGQRLMPARTHIEKRQPIGAGRAGIADLGDALTEEAGFSRRTLLIRGLIAAFAGLGAALAVPVFSLGPAPGRRLFESAWVPGARLGVAGGEIVTIDDIPVNGVLTVYPEGSAEDSHAATMLVRVDPDLLELEGEQAAWAPQGFVAYSKICTHAGCPVGLYRAAQHTLICPCHQSEFDVLRGGVPISGPAARALPQLPIQIQEDGTFVALGDFDQPVGPSFWNMYL
jgi:ubiquinol-cytochrome c reductase iron-sulfur subunit